MKAGGERKKAEDATPSPSPSSRPHEPGAPSQLRLKTGPQLLRISLQRLCSSLSKTSPLFQLPSLVPALHAFGTSSRPLPAVGGVLDCIFRRVVGGVRWVGERWGFCLSGRGASGSRLEERRPGGTRRCCVGVVQRRDWCVRSPPCGLLNRGRRLRWRSGGEWTGECPLAVSASEVGELTSSSSTCTATNSLEIYWRPGTAPHHRFPLQVRLDLSSATSTTSSSLPTPRDSPTPHPIYPVVLTGAFYLPVCTRTR